MPWVAVENSQTDLKKMLAVAFELHHNPTLIWVSPKTGEVMRHGMQAAEGGVDDYPWTNVLPSNSTDESDFEQLFKDNKSVVLKSLRGPNSVYSDKSIYLREFGTVIASIQLRRGLFYFEVEIIEMHGPQQLGFVTEGFDLQPTENSSDGAGVGDDSFSWSVDGTRKLKFGFFQLEFKFGTQWEDGDVIGFAVDLSHELATISYSVNGSFAPPNGLAFRDLDVKYLSPAFSGNGLFQVNFGEKRFRHKAPNTAYHAVHDHHSYHGDHFHHPHQQKTSIRTSLSKLPDKVTSPSIDVSTQIIEDTVNIFASPPNAYLDALLPSTRVGNVKLKILSPLHWAVIRNDLTSIRVVTQNDWATLEAADSQGNTRKLLYYLQYVQKIHYTHIYI
jgi:hypothetical protein